MIIQISPLEAFKMITQDGIIMIDVREKEEFQQEYIEGAIHIPLEEISINNIPMQNKAIIFQCRAGVRSMKACEIVQLYDKNLTLYNLSGGIIDWKLAALPTTQKT